MTTKTIQRLFFSATLCLALLPAGCLSKENIAPPYRESGVVIRFDRSAGSRNADDGNPVVFNTGYLFMTNTGGSIIRYFDIRSGAGESNPEAGYLYMSELESDEGVLIPFVPGNVRRIAIVGNTVLASAPAVGVNLATVRAQSINVLTQYDMDNVNLWGEVYYTETDQNRHSFWYFTGVDTPRRLYEVRVALFPTVARMELHRIEACPDSQIASFRVEGIFIDRHYYDAHVSGAIPGAGIAEHPNFISRGQDSALFQPGERGYDDDARALFDSIGIHSTGAGTNASPFAVTIPGTVRLFVIVGRIICLRCSVL